MAAFDGRRAIGCVSYLIRGSELVIYEVGKIKQKWSDATPLLITDIRFNPETATRDYLLRDSRGTSRWVREDDMAEAPEMQVDFG